MSGLPKVEVLKYNLHIEELGRDIKYRAFNNKEHKILLEAVELQDPAVLLNTILDIVSACIFNALDVTKIPTHITDYIYLQIHLKSTGRQQIATYTCGNVVDGVQCPGSFSMNLPLSDATLVYPTSYSKDRIIWIDQKKGIGIKMKVPSFEEMKRIDISKGVISVTDNFIMSCIESVFTKDTILVPGADFSLDECIEWFDGLDGSVLQAVSEFLKNMPYVGLTVSVMCPICKKKEELELKGIEDFFE